MVTRVNLISSQFSYTPAILAGLTGDQRYEAIFTLLKKFLVTGGDSYNIESLTIVDKKARVVTVEKNFYSVPGCKLAISGTNVSELDTRHELQEVFTDGFIFDIDLPDSVYTNGLTYNFPSLGWSLLEQDANRLLLKSNSFNIVIQQGTDTNNANVVMYWYYVEPTVTRLRDIFLTKPDYLLEKYYLPVCFKNNTDINNNSNFIYFLYGDENSLSVGGHGQLTSTPYKVSDRFSMSSTGKAAKTDPSTDVFFMAGRNSGVLLSTSFYGTSAYVHTPFVKTGYFNTEVINTSNSYNYIKTRLLLKIGDRLTINPGHFAGDVTGITSGKKSAGYVIPKSEKRFNRVSLYDENFYKVGYVPGIYYLDFNVNLIVEPSFSGFFPLKQTINKEARNTVIIRLACSNANNFNGEVNNWDYCYLLFDLTGPIS